MFKGLIQQEIIIYIELHDNKLTKESQVLLNIAFNLAQENNMSLCGIAICRDKSIELIEKINIYVIQTDTINDNREKAQILAKVIQDNNPKYFLFSNSLESRYIAAYVASMLNVGLTANCIKLSINKENGLLEQTRPTFGDSILATIITSNQHIQMCTIDTSKFIETETIVIEKNKKSSIIYSTSHNNGLLKLEKRTPKNTHNVDLTKATVIMCIGAGVKSKDYVNKVKFIADYYRASIGATRKIVEKGWMKPEFQIGYSGANVSPQVYITLGVSGSTYHMLGLKSVSKIISINNNPNANIHNFSDVSIIMDTNEFIDALYMHCEKEIIYEQHRTV